jgi:uncharacterized protein YndB with AHSA1/START domain
MDTQIAPHALALTRRIPARPETVFAAWTEADRVRQWMAPYGMTIPEARVEPRAGGRFDTTMVDAAGKQYDNRGSILELDPGRRLVLVNEGGCGEAIKGASCAVSFAPDPHGTRLEVVWHHATDAARAEHERMGFFAGWGQTLDRLSAHAAAPAQPPMPGMAPPVHQHGWLHRLLGDWTFESTGAGPDGKTFRSTGTERVRALGPFWVVGEADGACPGLADSRMVITMGFDAASGRFRGTWVGSMMGHMFVYDGALDEAAATLSLDSEGPSFTGEGTAKYRDIVQLVSETERVVTGNAVLPDGSLHEIMRATFRRVG